MPSVHYPKEWAEQNLSRAEIKTRQIEHAKGLLLDEGFHVEVKNMGYHFVVFKDWNKVADFWPTSGKVHTTTGMKFTGLTNLINYIKGGAEDV